MLILSTKASIHHIGLSAEIVSSKLAKVIWLRGISVIYCIIKNTNTIALVVFNKNAPHPNIAGYFIHIEPGNCMVGGGVWQTSPEYLKKIRQEISYSFDEFNGIISSKQFRDTFPSGIQGQSKLKKFTNFPEQREEVIELLKMKGFCTKELIRDKVLTSKDAIKTILNYFETTKPLIDYINTALIELGVALNQLNVIFLLIT